MKLLIVGGTRFAGRHLIGLALDAGHDLTLFNRGQSDPGEIPGVEQVHGDRDGGLAPLRGKRFDAVVDMCGYFPRVVRQSVDLVADTVERYVFVSSISVYADGVFPGFDESAPVREPTEPVVEEITDEAYGGLKVLCEREVQRGFPGAFVILRPGLIVGPLDRTDRFTSWVRRVAQGGEVLAPGPPELEVQFIDGRDLAAWMLRMAEEGPPAVYNANGPADPLTLGALLGACRDVSGSDATFVWVDEPFLRSEGVRPMTDLPFWIPPDDPDVSAPCDSSKAMAEGLKLRPVAETIADTLAWDRARPQEPMRAGLDRERERELLRRWRGRRT